MMLNIKTATIDDIEQYTNLLQKTYQTAYSKNEIGLTPNCFSKDIFKSEDTQKYLKSHLINTDKQSTWLAFDDEKLVGAITCIILNDNNAELTGFYVDPEKQRQGIGKKLYNLALNFVGNRDILLDIYAHNTKTIDMYKSWGWELDTSRGENGLFYRHWPEWPDELQIKCIYMKLKNKCLT